MVQLIIGHVSSKAARIWVKSQDGSAFADIILAAPMLAQSIKVMLSKDEYDTGVGVFSGLEPATNYQCTVKFEKGDTVTGSFNTMPEITDAFNFLLGSCNLLLLKDYFSPEFTRIMSIAEQEKSLFQISAGDQMYIDLAIRPYSVNSQDGYMRRYETTWHSEPLKKVFASIPQYMVIDDHEIFNDFANDKLNVLEQQWFEWGRNTYRIFQHAHNPQPFGPLPFYYSFNCAHADFFVMDLRTERQGKNMISDTQFDTLTQWLNREGTSEQIKIIVSSVPLITQVNHSEQKDKWAGGNYKEQRDLLLEILMKSKNTIVILSGDIHLAAHSFIAYNQEGKTASIHELISSPIKQVQTDLLSHADTATIDINGQPIKYVLDNHMGFPAGTDGKRHSLRNNIMGITVSKHNLSYRVYALNSDDLVFSGEIKF